MFTEYHLEKIIEAINEAERRQTQALLEAFSIDKLTKALDKQKCEQTVITAEKPEIKPIFHSTPPNQDSFFNKSDDKETDVRRKTFDKYGEVARNESEILQQAKKPLSKTPTTPKKPSTTSKKPTGVKK